MVLEKRKERRVRANLPIKITYQKNLEILGRTENISLLGTYLELDREMPAGIDADIALEIPAYAEDLSLAGEVKCKGNIFRCNLIREFESKKYYGIGIFFTDFLVKADRDNLSNYINFLIFQEKQAIQKDTKRWQDKRQAKRQDPHIQALDLLREILNRLEEISRLLKPRSA